MCVVMISLPSSSLLFSLLFFFLMIRRPPRSTLFPYRRSSDLLRQSDLPHVLAEVGMGGGLHPVRAVPEVDLVEVQLQNLLLAQDLLHLQGQERLLRLALEVPLGRQEERARQLLCDGAGALTDQIGRAHV